GPEALSRRAAIDRRRESLVPVAHVLRAVFDEEARPARPRHRQAKPQLATLARLAAQVADDEARLRVIQVDRTRDRRVFDARIRVRHVEIVDVLPVLPLQRRALAEAKQVRLLEADESPETGALSHRRAEAHLARLLLLHLEDDV